MEHLNGFVGFWTAEEAKLKSARQLGASACGPTALLSVLEALGYDVPVDSEKFRRLSALLVPQARLRRYESPLVDYLNSRVEAGTTHVDLISAIHSLDKVQDLDIHVRGFFVSFQDKVLWETNDKPDFRLSSRAAASTSEVVEFLAYWLERGAIPIATVNLMIVDNDAWHHQLIHGVDITTKEVYLCNPCEALAASPLRALICSDPWMRIPSLHVKTREEADPKNWDFLSDSPHMKRFSVREQIESLGPGSIKANPSRIPIDVASTLGDSELIIPWGGLAGITLFFRAGSKGHLEMESFAKSNSREINLPAYNLNSMVAFYNKSYKN